MGQIGIRLCFVEIAGLPTRWNKSVTASWKEGRNGSSRFDKVGLSLCAGVAVGVSVGVGAGGGAE